MCDCHTLLSTSSSLLSSTTASSFFFLLPEPLLSLFCSTPFAKMKDNRAAKIEHRKQDDDGKSWKRSHSRPGHGLPDQENLFSSLFLCSNTYTQLNPTLRLSLTHILSLSQSDSFSVNQVLVHWLHFLASLVQCVCLSFAVREESAGEEDLHPCKIPSLDPFGGSVQKTLSFSFVTVSSKQILPLFTS